MKRLIKKFLFKFSKNHTHKALSKLINKLNMESIIYVDVGARGDLTYPWNIIEDMGKLKVLGFEVDKMEADNLKRRFPNREYFPYAASDNDNPNKLSIAFNPLISSPVL